MTSTSFYAKHTDIGQIGYDEILARTILIDYAAEKSRHRPGGRAVVCARSVPDGLHHECSLTHQLA